MGLLSFLTRRNVVDRAPESPVKGQAYHSTAASLPPVRGTHPVAGNGPVSYEQLRRAAGRKRSQPQMSATLKPFFLGSREERPSSAPYEDSPDWRPKSSGRNPRDALRGFQFPLISNHGLGRRNSRFDADTESLPASIPSLARDASTGPARSTSRHVDILDAQGDFKPYDFKSRVQAAGTRDYGEDVADRNMDQNGVTLATPAFSSYDASSIRTLSIRSRAGNSGSMARSSRQVVGLPAIAQLDEQPLPARRGGQKRNSLISVMSTDEVAKQQRPARAPRTKSLDSTALLSLPEGYLSRSASTRGQRGAEDRAVDRRREDRSRSRDGNASPRIWISRERREPNGEMREHRRSLLGPPIVEYQQLSDRSASPPAVPRYRPRTALGVAAEHTLGRSSPAPSVRRARQGERSGSRGTEAGDYRTFSLSSTSRQGYYGRDRHSDAMSLHSNLSYVNRRRDYREPLDAPLEAESSDDNGSLSDCAPAPRVSNNRRGGDASPGVVRSRKGRHQPWNSPWSSVRADSYSTQPGPSADLAASLAHSRNRSWSCLPAVPGRAHLDEYGGYIPARRSSLRQWSVSSITPTTEMSVFSSNPTARPRSTHTANTSVDAPFSVASAKPSELRDSPGGRSHSRDRPGSSLYITAQEDDTLSDTSSTSRPGSRAGFEPHRALDDDRELEDEEDSDSDAGSSEDSEDGDSFIEKRGGQVRFSGDDESLLLKEADLGNKLPGLFETEAKQSCLMCSLLQCAAVDPPFDASGTGTWTTRPPCDHKGGIITRRDRLRALGYEYDTEDSQSETELDGEPDPEPENEAPRGRKPNQRPAPATAGSADTRDDGIDGRPVATTLPASKPRREGKKRRLGARKRSPAIEPVMEDYEEGHTEDEE